jgi:hypothetical protein
MQDFIRETLCIEVEVIFHFLNNVYILKVCLIVFFTILVFVIICLIVKQLYGHLWCNRKCEFNSHLLNTTWSLVLQQSQ